MRFLVIGALIGFSLMRPAFGSVPYCLALRGNGELQPAHWGALANVIEKLGLPAGQAGGSSAAVSIFLLDAIATNPILQTGDEISKKNKAALMVKAIQGVAEYLISKKEVQTALGTYASIQLLDVPDKLNLLKTLVENPQLMTHPNNAQKLNDLLKFFAELQRMGVLSAPTYTALFNDLKDPNNINNPLTQKRIQFYANELYQAVGVMGDFNAETDANLFFRPGIIDFSQLALSFGKIATFMAGEDFDTATQAQFKQWIDQCSLVQIQKSWLTLKQEYPEICAQSLEKTLNSFFSQQLDWNKINFANKNIGTSIPSYPTTTIITDSAAQQVQQAFVDYSTNLNLQFGFNFKVDDINKIRFAYWGNPDALKSTQANLLSNFPNDEKSQRFLNLGMSSWQTALSYSPAEPGLSPFLPMNINGELAFSAGGWSDLHPVTMLKMSGCEQVVYVTRQGGETVFGQGVAKRLFGFDRAWHLLSKQNPDIDAINNNGDSNDLTSLWSRLYNIANSDSSYRVSLQLADAVLCTDWDQFKITEGYQKMIDESYQAPYVVKNQSSTLATELANASAAIVSESSETKWNGCR